MSENVEKTKFQILFNSFRPWSLSAAVISVTLGAVWALKAGYFNWWLFILTVIGGCLLQAASNLFNTYGDYVTGVDTVESAVRSPELVRGEMKPSTIKWAAIWCCIITAIIGIVFIITSGWQILIFGVVGILCAYGYTMGVSFKYHGMGLIGVFILMGEIMVLGSYFVLAGSVDWMLAIVSIPNACLVTAILNGNELRDYYCDKEVGVGTLSVKMGYMFSFRLYQILHILPFIMVLGLAITKIITPWSLLVFLLVPSLIKLINNMYVAKSGDKKANIMLVSNAFSMHWQFGTLMIIGLLINIFI